MKKILSFLLALILLVTVLMIAPVSVSADARHVFSEGDKTIVIAEADKPPYDPAAFEPSCVYARASSDADNKEAWVKWQEIDNIHYFFLPSSATAYDTVELYNTYDTTVIIGGTQIPSSSIVTFAAEAGKTYNSSIEPLDLAVYVQFIFSSAETPSLPPEDVIIVDLTNAVAAWTFDATGKTEGDKLKEYGSADEGYNAVEGHGKMTLSVSGSKNRALEWSAPEYGKSGTLMTPIMAAGSKNQWGSPYIDLSVPTKGYDQLKITMYLAGSNKAPASWKLQYSTNGTDFTDIDGMNFTIPAESRKTITAYFDRSDLPDFTYGSNDESIDLRLVPVSMTTVDGGSALETPTSGELAINCIVVEGRKLTYDDVVMGDADEDGDITIIDATVIQRYLADINRLTSKQIIASDVARDGAPDIVDATGIQRALAGIVNPFFSL